MNSNNQWRNTIAEKLKHYPGISACFDVSDISKIKYGPKNPNPLVKIIVSDGDKKVSSITDQGFKIIKKYDPNWLRSKRGILLGDDLRNVSATLGEIRAYGALLQAWGKRVTANSNGYDFEVMISKDRVRIEVHTICGRTQRSRIDHGVSKKGGVSFGLIELFPFGYPQRQNVDNVQGEAISKIAAIKQQEHQFDGDEFNVLWIDLNDPIAWPVRFNDHQFSPLASFREELTSGCIWNALYGRKGMPIYDGLSVIGLPSRTYRMEFDGRFRDSKIDLVVGDNWRQCVFQNPNRIRPIPDELYKGMFRLPGFNLELSWIDWPIRGELMTRVENELKRINAYEKAFR